MLAAEVLAPGARVALRARPEERALLRVAGGLEAAVEQGAKPLG